MAKGPRYKVPFRRRREGRTDYRHRARLLRSGMPRAVVRRSQNHTTIQFIEYGPEGDRVMATAHSRDIRKMGWEASTGTLPVAYLTGYLAGKRAVEKGIESAVLDIGLQVPAVGGCPFAALKGMLDAGVDIPHGEEVLPPEDRLMGDHIGEDLRESVENIMNKIEGD
ncbi:MAG: 50S ribosomal protein L18 [Methanomassiliicoccales archaeon]